MAVAVGALLMTPAVAMAMATATSATSAAHTPISTPHFLLPFQKNVAAALEKRTGRA